MCDGNVNNSKFPAFKYLICSTFEPIGLLQERNNGTVESLSYEDGIVNKTFQNNRLNYRIQSLHVGMQPPGHFLRRHL